MSNQRRERVSLSKLVRASASTNRCGQNTCQIVTCHSALLIEKVSPLSKQAGGLSITFSSSYS